MRKSHFALCMNCMNQWQLCFARPFHGRLCTPRENPHLELQDVASTTRDLVWFVALLDYANSLMALTWNVIPVHCTEFRSHGTEITKSHNARIRQTQCHITPPFFAVFASAFFCPCLGMGVDDTDEGSHQQGLIWFPEESVKSWLRHTKTNMHFGDHGNKVKSWAKSWWRPGPVRNNLSQ